MFKSPNAPKLIPRPFSLHPKHFEMIAHFMKDKGFVSQSDVVRQAITFFHDKTFPDYVYRETATGEIKRSKKDEEIRVNNLSPLDYVKEFIPGALILPGRDGDYVIIHNVANSVVAYPLANIKQAMEKDPEALNIHLKLLNERPVSDLLSPYQNSLLESDYGIIVPDNLVWGMVKSESEGNPAS